MTEDPESTTVVSPAVGKAEKSARSYNNRGPKRPRGGVGRGAKSPNRSEKWLSSLGCRRVEGRSVRRLLDLVRREGLVGGDLGRRPLRRQARAVAALAVCAFDATITVMSARATATAATRPWRIPRQARTRGGGGSGGLGDRFAHGAPCSSSIFPRTRYSWGG